MDELDMDKSLGELREQRAELARVGKDNVVLRCEDIDTYLDPVERKTLADLCAKVQDGVAQALKGVIPSSARRHGVMRLFGSHRHRWVSLGKKHVKTVVASNAKTGIKLYQVYHYEETFECTYCGKLKHRHTTKKYSV